MAWGDFSRKAGQGGPKAPLLVVAAVAAFLSPAAALAGVAGEVREENGAPVAGLLVVWETDRPPLRSVSVLSDSEGRFAFPDEISADPSAAPELRILKVGFSEAARRVERTGAADYSVTITVQPVENVAGEAPPSAWLRDFPHNQAAHATVASCAGCHEFADEQMRGYAALLKGLDAADREEAWRSIIQYMRIKMVSAFWRGEGLFPAALAKPQEGRRSPVDSVISNADEALIAPFLAAHMPTDFTRLPLRDCEKLTAPQRDHGAVLWEFQLPPPSGMWHDVHVARDGEGRVRAWAVDFHNDRLVSLDPAARTLETHPVPPEVRGLHTLVPDESGALWITGMGTSVLGRYEPASRSWTTFPVPSPETIGEDPFPGLHSFANTSRYHVGFDAKGRLWANFLIANKLAALDPATGTWRFFDAPGRGGFSTIEMQAYTGVMTSDRRYVWFTQLGGSQLFEFDTETEKVGTVVTFAPGDGPRRPAIDDNDVIYFPLYGAGQLVLYDARKRREIGRYDFPDRRCAVYAVGWDPGRNAVWAPGNSCRVIYRFDVATRTFSQYPLPRDGAPIRTAPVDPEQGRLFFTVSDVANSRSPNTLMVLEPGDGGRP